MELINLQKLTSGGMAEIYKATQKSLRRQVIIKKLHSHLLENKEVKKRFEQEAYSLAQLKHPHIVDIYEYGVAGEECFIIMEYIKGKDLDQYLNEKKMNSYLGLIISREVCEGLRYIHQQGIIHRDLKPANIMIDQQGIVKLTDFGISKVVGGGKDSLQQTDPGKIIGTPLFMSPEQTLGEDLDPRSDIFSFGIILYLLLTNQLPFQADDRTTLFHQIIEAQYPSPLKFNPHLPAQLVFLVNKCLQKEKEKRFQKIEEVKNLIDQFFSKLGISDFERELERFVADEEKYLLETKDRLFFPTAQEKKRKKQQVSLVILVFLIAVNFYLWVFFQKTRFSPSSPGLKVPPKIKVEKELGVKLPPPPSPPFSQALPQISKEPPSKVSPGAAISGRTEKKRPSVKPSPPSGKKEVVIPQPVYINTTPCWAEVYLNGKYRGQTPLNLTLLPGEYKLKLVNEIAHRWEGKIKITPSEEKVKLIKKLTLLPAYLENKFPQGSRIFIDEIFITTVQDLPLIEIPFQKISYQPDKDYHLKVEIPHQKPISLQIKLRPTEITKIKWEEK